MPKNGYYLEEIKNNMRHIEKMLKPRLPTQANCLPTMKQKKFPLLILADNQEIVDLMLANDRIASFLTGGDFSDNILTIHMSD